MGYGLFGGAENMDLCGFVGVIFDREAQVIEQKINNYNPKVNIFDTSSNGEFDVIECFYRAGKGFASPVINAVEHPIEAIGAAIALGGLTYITGGGAALPYIFGAYGAYNMADGAYSAYDHYNKGEYDKAEESFEQIGSGLFNVVTSIQSIKPEPVRVNLDKIQKAQSFISHMAKSTKYADDAAAIASELASSSKTPEESREAEK